MEPYPKIQTVWDRDPETSFKRLIDRKWARPEFQLLQNAAWLWTEKVDGTNIRVMLADGQVSFGGRTDAAQIPAPLLARLHDIFPLEKLEAQFGQGRVCLYGEGFGDRIQKGGELYRRGGADFALFDVRIGDWWLEWENVCAVGEALGCTVAPVISVGTLNDAIARVRDGFTSHCSDEPRDAEGLVLRPIVDLFNRKGERVMAKVKHRDFA